MSRSLPFSKAKNSSLAQTNWLSKLTSHLPGDSSSDIKPHLPGGYAKTGRNIDRTLEEVTSEADLMPEGAEPGTVPTDLEQATGLERLEILGKMQGVDIFDMKPLPADRVGTLKDPILVRSFGDEQYLGCTGAPADSHHVIWLTISRDRPLGRCPECGSCYEMEYVGPTADAHGHDDHGDHGHDAHHGHEERKSFADYIKPEYYYR